MCRILATSTLAAYSQDASVTFQSPETQVSLVELYTSEGCSSCPPAERWLSAQKDSSSLWKRFVPIAFHVDYWDGLGWRDPWSSRQFTDRQQDYAQRWHSDTVYTPELVLNGREWRNWSGFGGAPVSGVTVGKLTVTSTNNAPWRATFAPAKAQGGYELHAALLSSALNSDVKAGENSGRHLTHDFVALRLISAPLNKTGDGYEAEFTLPPASGKQGRLALAVWVTTAGGFEPVQATGGWLPAPH